MDLIKESIKELKLNNAKQREDHIEKLLDYYNGNNTSAYIQNMFSARPNPSAFDQPLTNWIVTGITNAYEFLKNQKYLKINNFKN